MGKRLVTISMTMADSSGMPQTFSGSRLAPERNHDNGKPGGTKLSKDKATANAIFICRVASPRSEPI